MDEKTILGYFSRGLFVAGFITAATGNYLGAVAFFLGCISALVIVMGAYRE